MPLCTAATIFCRCGANGVIVRSIVLPLAFSYSATTFLIASSSSSAKPCAHHTVAVVAAALVTKGRVNVPAAARPSDPRSTERLVDISYIGFRGGNASAGSRPNSKKPML